MYCYTTCLILESITGDAQANIDAFTFLTVDAFDSINKAYAELSESIIELKALRDGISTLVADIEEAASIIAVSYLSVYDVYLRANRNHLSIRTCNLRRLAVTLLLMERQLILTRKNNFGKLCCIILEEKPVNTRVWS